MLKTKFLSTVPFLLLALVSSFTMSCGVDQKGMVLFTDPSYQASVIGTEKDGFAVPDGILWRYGRLYIADEGGSAFRIWSGPGRVATLSDASNGVLSPEDIAVDAQGNIFFTDDDTGGVWRINNFGVTQQIAGKEQGLISTEGIVLAPNGNLLVGDGEVHKVFSVTPNGQVSVFLGPEYGIGKAESMVFDNEGNLYIADNDARTVYLLTPDKVLHQLIHDREGFSPETLWYSKGVLYITDSDDGKLFKYTPQNDLEPLAVFGGKLAKVNGITTDDADAIYLSVQTDLKKKTGYILKIEHESFLSKAPL
jgi:sugar lactone lactonase YvrE